MQQSQTPVEPPVSNSPGSRRVKTHQHLLAGLHQHLHVGDDERLGIQQAGLADQEHDGVDDQVLRLLG